MFEYVMESDEQWSSFDVDFDFFDKGMLLNENLKNSDTVAKNWNILNSNNSIIAW